MTAQPVPRPTEVAANQWSKEDLELAAARGQHSLISQALDAGQLADLLGHNPTNDEGNQA